MNGKVVVSKYSGIKLGKIVPSKHRFNNYDNKVPGANNYPSIDDLSPKGKYVVSKFKSAGNRAFNHTSRINFTETYSKKFTNIPGPGQYNLPS